MKTGYECGKCGMDLRNWNHKLQGGCKPPIKILTEIEIKDMIRKEIELQSTNNTEKKDV